MNSCLIQNSTEISNSGAVGDFTVHLDKGWKVIDVYNTVKTLASLSQ